MSEQGQIVTALQTRANAHRQLIAVEAQEAVQLQRDTIALREYEAAVASGTVTTQQFESIMARTSIQAREYAIQTKGAAGSAETFAAKQTELQAKLSATSTTAKGATIAVKAFSVALNMIAVMAITTAITKIVSLLGDFANQASVASEKADELFSKTSEKVSNNKEEIDSLDNLISKYKELASSEYIDVEKRTQIKEIQSDIAELVGAQASSLDLVNGKLDEEIKKLNTISESKAKEAFETASANYYNSEDASEKATGDSKVLFTNYDYAGKVEDEARRILMESGFGQQDTSLENRDYSGYGKGLGSDGILGSKMVVSTAGLDDAKEKANYLQEMIDVLELNGQKSTELYRGLIDQRDEYLTYVDNQESAANSLVSSWIDYSKYSNDELSKISVNSVDSFEKYRNTMINELKRDDTISSLISEGLLDESSLENSIDEYMATSESFSEWYEEWVNSFEENSTAISPISSIDILSEIEALSDGFDKLDKIYSDVYDQESFDWSSVLNNDDFTETFGNMENVTDEYKDAYANFIQTIAESPDDINACQSSFNDLATAYLYNSGALDNVTESTKQATITMLEQMGIENAKEIVEAKLASSQYALAIGMDTLDISSRKAIDTTYAQINSLIEEGEVCGTTATSLYNLVAQQTIFSNQNLNTGEKIAQLEKLAKSFGLTADSAYTATNAINKALSKLPKISLAESSANDPLNYRMASLESNDATLKTATDMAYDDLSNNYQNQIEAQFGRINANYTGGSTTQSAINKSNGTSSGGGSDNSSAASTLSTTSETFDFIETAIERCETKLDKFNDIAGNTYKNLTTRVNAYNNAIAATTEEINLQNSAYSAYMAKANSYGLEEGWAAQVRDGAINIAEITDEGLKVRIQGYQEYYDKALEAQNKVVELQSSLNELNINKLQLSIDKANSNLEEMERVSDSIQSRIDNEARVTRKSDYDKQNKSYKDQIENLEYTNTLLLQQRQYVDKDSEEWSEITSTIRDNRDTIYDLTQQIADNKNLKIEIDITKAEHALDKLSNAYDRIQSKIDIKESFGNTGNKSNYTALNSNILKQIKNYQKQITLLEKQQKNVKKGSEAWYEYQDAINSNKQSIDDLNQSIIENAQTIASLASTTASNKVDKLDASDELLQARADNYVSVDNQNKMINQQIKNITSRQNAYDQAVASDKSGLKTYTRSINNTLATKANKTILAKVKKYVNAGKRIPDSVLISVEKVDASFGRKCAMYNAYFDQLEVDSATAKLYEQTSKQDLAELEKQKFDNIQTSYGNKTSKYSQRNTELQSSMDNAEASGYRISDTYYKKLIANEKKNNALLEEERSKLISSLASSLKNGSIKQYSDEWYEMVSSINEVTNAIDDSNASLIEYQNSLRELSWDNFDKLQESISDIADENQFLIDELSRDDLANDDTAGLTANGQAVMALHASNYEVYRQQASDYAKEIESINKELAKDPYNETLLEQKKEYIKAEQDAISAAEDEKAAIIDLAEQGYQALENHIGDLISDYKELINQMKDAYDYQQSIEEKTKNIGDIQKQLQAYSGDMSEENRATVQKLQVSLRDAQTDLRDTEYDKMLSNTSDMLDDLSDDLSDYISDLVNELDGNFDELISSIVSNSASVSETIISKMDELDYSGGLRSIYEGNEDIISATKTALTNTKEFQDEMIAYAKEIADTTTTDAATEATNKANASIQSSGNAKLQSDIAQAQNDYDNSYTQAKTQSTKDKQSYESYTEQAANAKYIYTMSKANGVKGKELQALKDEYLELSALAAESKEKYISSRDYAKSLKYNKTVMDYLGKHLDITTESESGLSDLNKVLYNNYGQRILDDSEVKELTTKLGISSTSQSSKGDLYKKLHELGIRGFKVGSPNIAYDQLALLAEEGSELQFDKSQGVLRTVGQGDKIFTSAMADNLWNIAKTPNISTDFDLSKILPNNISSVENTPINIDLGGITMNGVNDPEEFVSIMEDAMKNNTKIRKLAKNITVETLGKNYNSLSSRRY